jgi:hypothetical protein
MTIVFQMILAAGILVSAVAAYTTFGVGKIGYAMLYSGGGLLLSIFLARDFLYTRSRRKSKG